MYITLEEAKNKGYDINRLSPLKKMADTDTAKDRLAKLAKCSNYSQIHRHAFQGDLPAVAINQSVKSRSARVTLYCHEDWLKEYLDNFFTKKD